MANETAAELLYHLGLATSPWTTPDKTQIEDKMDHSLHKPLDRQEYTASVLVGAPVYGAGDRKVGTISHLHGSGATTEVVIDVGGFLGIGAKPVLVSIDQLNMMRDENGNVHGSTAWTRDQLRDLPEHLD